MFICNDDLTLVLYLWSCIQALLAGTDPWQIWFDITQLVETCGKVVMP